MVRETAPLVAPSKIPTWVPWVLLPLLIAIAYLQVRHAGFIWDDDQHLTENPCVVGPGGFLDIWTSSHARICPLVISSFWLQHQLWGLNPLPYHLVNAAMHAAAALALWRALLALGVRGAWLGATLWALHPVQVESVAWITELKNTQSGLFFALTVLFFVRWLKGERSARRRWHHAAMLLFAALAIASKASTVVLPVILALCAWWVERRWQWRSIARTLPVLVLAAVSATLAIWTQELEGANEPEWGRSITERLIVAGQVPWFYLGKLLWPAPLIFIYPRWATDPSRFIEWLPALAALLGLAWLWWLRQGIWRPIFMAASCFMVALLPVLGLVDHYFLRYSFVGDHFQYLASMAPMALVGAGIATLARLAKGSWWMTAITATLLIAILGAMTWRQVPVYTSSLTLWSDTIARNPHAWMAWNNLGRVLMDSGRTKEAIEHFRNSLQIHPTNVRALNHLGIALLKDGQPEEAIDTCRQILKLNPRSADALTNMGNAFLLLGREVEAVSSWNDALAAEPGYAEAHINLCVAQLRMNRMKEALEHGRQAVQFQPQNALAQSTLASALQMSGHIEEAISHLEISLTLDPSQATAHHNLAICLRQTGRILEAMPHYEKAAALMPDSIPLLNSLAWALATCPDDRLRNGRRAIELSQRTLTLLGSDNPSLMRTLAAAHAAEGEFESAREIARNALSYARADGHTTLAQDLGKDLDLYRLGAPRLEPAPESER